MKIKPKHWWQYLSLNWWKCSKALKIMIEYQRKDPKYKKELTKLIKKGVIMGDKITEEDIIKAVERITYDH